MVGEDCGGGGHGVVDGRSGGTEVAVAGSGKGWWSWGARSGLAGEGEEVGGCGPWIRWEHKVRWSSTAEDSSNLVDDVICWELAPIMFLGTALDGDLIAEI